jgi:nitrate/TMAO reductase-like tetraheme cytochrome c subunit
MPTAPERPVLAVITSHWLSMLGAGLVTTAAICWLVALPQQINGHAANPYIGLLLFVALPVVFFLGLALIPLGLHLARRRVEKGLAAMDRATSLRRLGLFVACTTGFNLIAGTQLTYRAVEHMETVEFCGATCHMMKPEFTAYQNAAHSKVACVECHVAPGAAGWVRSKSAGVRQLAGTVLGRFERPISPPLETGRRAPTGLACDNCHTEKAPAETQMLVFPAYAEDEANTRTTTVLNLFTDKIHRAHRYVRYATHDRRKADIPWVDAPGVADPTGPPRIFGAPGAKPIEVDNLVWVEMHCSDCHNRPAHNFDPPERAVNRAMAEGRIPASLPWIRKLGVDLLRTAYASREEALRRIPDDLAAAFAKAAPGTAHSRQADLKKASLALADIFQRNVFPEMKVTWGTYPNHLGHTDSPGCFRCHDGSHTAAGAEVISQDCTSCHQLVAVDEASPEILSTLGIAPQ